MFLQIRFSPQIETLRYTIVYIALFILIIVALVIFFTNFFVKFLEKRKKQNFENPNRKTTKQDISLISDILKLTPNEKNLLWKICEENSVKNLYVELKNEEFIDSIFRKEFEQIKDDENKTDLLFSIRNKIDFHKSSTMKINSSTVIPTNQNMTLLLNEDRYELTLIENTKEGLILSTPKDILGNEINIPALTKINLIFSLTNNVAYEMTSRIIRYQTRVIKEMITTHSKDISILHRRNFTRLPFNTECIFSAVQIVTGGEKKEVEVEYRPLEKKHAGILTDISADGCCIETELPIRANQYIYAEIQIQANLVSKIIGKIVATEINKKNNMHILHIKFIKIDKKTKNTIFSIIYNYK